MHDRELRDAPRFHFALPRLVWTLCGGNGARTDTNWLEANVVGSLMHVVAFAFGAHLLLPGLRFWQQLLLLAPLAILFWLFWMVFFYAGTLLIAALRAIGAFRGWSQARAQGFIAGTMITLFAFELLRGGGWYGLLGSTWMIAVSLNLLAALLLKFSHAEHA